MTLTGSFWIIRLTIDGESNTLPEDIVSIVFTGVASFHVTFLSRLVVYLSYAVSFSFGFPSTLAIAFSLALFDWFRMTTDLHVPTNSTLAVSSVYGKFHNLSSCARLSTSPTFALPWLLAIRSFIAFTSVFPGIWFTASSLTRTMTPLL